MGSVTHYIQGGSALCSHASEESESSDSILDVTCGHCWDEYDEIEGRKPNVPEMRKYAGHLEWSLDVATKQYHSEGRVQRITGLGLCIFEGPDNVPEDIAQAYSDEDSPFQKDEWEALRASARITFMTAGRKSDTSPSGVWEKKYQEAADRVIRAVQPALIEREEAEGSRITSDLRREVMEREDAKCDICGETLSDSESESGKTLTIDHIFPRILGGPTEEWNLRLLCRSCNSFKHVLLDPGGVEKAADRLENQVEW